jgi:hypothetical protein
MTTALCILNLTARERPLTLDPSIIRTTSIQSPTLVPGDEKLVLYIVGHGVQHGMVEERSGKIWDESELLAAIQACRKDLPTVIVWDTCFAESVLHISSRTVMAPAAILPAHANSWPPNFLHVFSCLAFERTWHAGAEAPEPSVTSFSCEFARAVRNLQKETNGTFDWGTLQTRLREQYESIQRPRVVPLEGPCVAAASRERSTRDVSWRKRLQPSDFDLGKLFAPAAKTVNGSPAKSVAAALAPSEMTT